MHATTRTRHPLWAVGALATALALPSAARAQQPLTPVQVTVEATGRADALDARAEAYEAANRHLGRAASLREQAAQLRAPEDPRGFRSLWRAAHLRYYGGQPRAAVGLMERAADQAVARGDVANAATAYIDAAYIATELRDPMRVREFLTKGTLLMHSPLLSAPEREALRGRVAETAPLVRDVAAALHP